MSLALAVMVLVTLGIGMRVKEKLELQALADASAYSNAVAAARTMNDIALLNRTQVSFWVSMAADQGLISWASAQRANLFAVRQGLRDIANGTQTVGGCSAGGALNALDAFPEDLLGDLATYTAADTAAGLEVRAIQGTISRLRDQSEAQRLRLLNSFNVGAQNPLTEAILQKARIGTPFPNELQQHTLGAHLVNGRELSTERGAQAPLNRGSGFISDARQSQSLQLAAMGSRGNPWVVSHTGLSTTLAAAAANVQGLVINANGLVGGHTWGANAEDDSGATNARSISHDHGVLSVSFNNCVRNVPVNVVLTTTDVADEGGPDAHIVTPSDVREGGDVEHHTVGDCGGSCPSVWVRPVGFTPGQDSAQAGSATEDAQGQPKLYSVVHRNLAARGAGDPWNLVFTFNAFPGGGDGEFDNRGLVLRSPGGGALDVSQQAALSTGMAYYHRKNQWLEFPNLLNPFWRATLVSSDVDLQGKFERGGNDDIPRALGGPQTEWQGEAYRALKTQGFQGVH